MTVDTISLIMQVLSLIIAIYISIINNLKNVYIINFIFNAVQLIMYLCIGDKVTAISYIIIVARSFVVLYRDKIHCSIVPWLFCLAHVLTYIFTGSNITQLISTITPCVMTLFQWFAKSNQNIRVGSALTNAAWFMYNLLSGLYIAAIMRVVLVLSNVITYVHNRGHVEE